ncbi:MAG: hypothetical protein V4757_06625 [Pseudomonadota bacterium]
MIDGGFTTFQKHFQTVLTTITSATILFCAGYIYDASKEQAVMAANMQALTSQIAKLEMKLDQFQGSYVTRLEHKDHEDRLRRLERR